MKRLTSLAFVGSSVSTIIQQLANLIQEIMSYHVENDQSWNAAKLQTSFHAAQIHVCLRLHVESFFFILML